jgi:hypothetical protein
MVAAAPVPVQPTKLPPTCANVGFKAVHPATNDPTSFADDPGIVLAPGRHVLLDDVTVVLRFKGRLLGSAHIDNLSTSGTVLRLQPPQGEAAVRVPAGVSTVTATGTRHLDCPHRHESDTVGWSFTKPSLPVRAAPATTFIEDARKSGLRLYLRTVGHTTASSVTATLLDGKAKPVGHATVPGTLTNGAIIDVPVPGSLPAGRYTLLFAGRAAGAKKPRTFRTPVVLGTRSGPGQPPVDADAGLSEQHVVVDWSDNKAFGRDTTGFVAPGIGYGEIVCGFQQQHVRFFPNDLNREQSMMLWTYKDWVQDHEKSIRESIHNEFSGPDFQEGLNKFSPPEKHMTGEYEGLIADRGVLDAPFGSELAPPTYIDLTWDWDFSNPRHSRCHVDATLRTENGSPTETRPLARSLQVVWRSDDNAPGHDTVTTSVPGVGTVTLVCQAKPDGTRTITVDPATDGGAVIRREGGDDSETDLDRGPIVAQLPNNGQLKLGLFGGASALVTSRWKVNDPTPAENSCKVAAQVVVR